MKNALGSGNIQEKIRILAEKNSRKMVEFRRYFHAHPETAFKEIQTSRYIKSQLGRLKISAKAVAKTGLLGLLKGRSDNPICAIRADMDALPVLEKTDLPFKSKNSGCMHACGHDIHMAAALGAAMILKALKTSLNGSVKFIFQPAEEEPPGGAIEMIRGGVMKNPPVKMIFSLHTDPNILTGKIGIKDGVMMAEVLDFNILVKGRGGHGARPHDTIDSIMIASQLVGALQNVVSRNLDPKSPAVLTIGVINGGTARNVIADEVLLKGTIRGLETETVMKARKSMERIVAGVCASGGCKFNIDYIADYPILENNSGANRLIRETALDLYGKNSVIQLKQADMGGEDFARYLKYAPGAMFRLGVRNPRVGAVYQWHNDKYNSDEKSMIYGSAVLAGAVLKYFDKKG